MGRKAYIVKIDGKVWTTRTLQKELGLKEDAARKRIQNYLKTSDVRKLFSPRQRKKGMVKESLTDRQAKILQEMEQATKNDKRFYDGYEAKMEKYRERW